MKKRDTSHNYIKWILTASAFLCGLSYPFLLFTLTVVLCALLGYGACRENGIRVYRNRNVLAGSAYIGAAFLAFLCGIDKGTAFIGFLRVLAAGIWVLFLMQKTKEEREEAFGLLPASGVVMVLMALIFCRIPDLRGLIINSGRLGGFFQYANTMALYLLLALVLLLEQIMETQGADSSKANEKKRWMRKDILHLLMLLVLLTGIFWTGSRLTFVLSAGVCFWLFWKKKILRKWILFPYAVCLIGAFLLAGRTGNVTSFGRFLTISFQESTLLGRLLYWKDAIPLLLQHPLGLGYLGYYEIQPLIRNGVYSVRYVHNDWLQIALDHGLVAFGAFLFLVVRAWKRGDGKKRLLLVIIGVHLFFDPDLAFPFVTLFLLCMMDWEEKNAFPVSLCTKTCRKKQDEMFALKGKKWSLAFAGFAVMMLWFAVAGFLEESGKYELSAKLYPFKSSVQEHLMVQQEDTESAAGYAERIVNANPYSSAGWLVQSYYYRDEKKYDAMFTALQHYIALNRYNMTAYSEYIHLLDEAAAYSAIQGERKAASKYREELLQVPQMVQKVKKQTDPLAWKIKDKPSFEIPREDAELILFYQNNPF